jgi:SAM-dependent methyltransferase
MAEQRFGNTFRENPSVIYERFFVPAIGMPLATDLIRVAALRAGERVLDVACGTGVVARLASRQVGATGTVVGLDVNPGMLATARASTSPGMHIAWHQANAEAMPLSDASFDVVLCQMGLQFMLNRDAALREMRRVLVPGGRVSLNVPGPTPNVFTVMAVALGRHIGAEAAGFVNQVFSLAAPASTTCSSSPQPSSCACRHRTSFFGSTCIAPHLRVPWRRWTRSVSARWSATSSQSGRNS